METALAVIGGLISLAGGILSYPLAEMVGDFQERAIKNDLATARKMIDQYESKLPRPTTAISL